MTSGRRRTGLHALLKGAPFRAPLTGRNRCVLAAGFCATTTAPIMPPARSCATSPTLAVHEGAGRCGPGAARSDKVATGHHFMTRRYSMYENHFGFRQRPFAATPDGETVFWSDTHRRAFDAIRDALLQHAPGAVITGDSGTGKTTLLLALDKDPEIAKQYSSTTVFIPSCRGDELLLWILAALRNHAPAADPARAPLDRIAQVLRTIHDTGRRPLLLIDEAQSICKDGVAALNQVLELQLDTSPPVHVVLAGMPRLRTNFFQASSPLAIKRLEQIHVLEPLEEAETAAYVQSRMQTAGADPAVVFDPAALATIHRRSAGVPRVINTVCDACLHAACREGVTCIDGQMAQTRQDDPLGEDRLSIALSEAKERREQAPKPPAPAPDANPPPDAIQDAPLAKPAPPGHVRSRASRLRFGAGAAVAATAALAVFALLPQPEPDDPGQDLGVTVNAQSAAGPAQSAPATEQAPALRLASASFDPAEAQRFFLSALSQARSRDAALDYARAAIRGHARSAYYLGQVYETGDGVPQAPQAARAWYAWAAAQGSLAAQTALEALGDRTPDAGPIATPVFLNRSNGLMELVWLGNGPFQVQFSDTSQRPVAYHDTDVTALRLSSRPDLTGWRVVAQGAQPGAWMRFDDQIQPR